MARRRVVTDREGAISRGRFDSVENREARQVKRGVDAFDRPEEGNADIYAPWEDDNLVKALEQLESSAGQTSTGFGRRLFGQEQRQWDPEVPYPQIEPSNTTNEERPRTIAMGYDPGSNIVRVTFRPDKSGHSAIYEYYGVPEPVYAEFASNYSPGRFISDFLDGYLYVRRYDLE